MNTLLETKEIDGCLIEIYLDEFSSTPWREMYTFGEVKKNLRHSRNKKPGEMWLGENYLYDFQSACKKARSEGMSKKDASEAAWREFQLFKSWLNDEWYYCYVNATLLNTEREKTFITYGLGGIPSMDIEYYIQGLIKEVKLEAMAYKTEETRFLQTLVKELV